MEQHHETDKACAFYLYKQDNSFFFIVVEHEVYDRTDSEDMIWAWIDRLIRLTKYFVRVHVDQNLATHETHEGTGRSLLWTMCILDALGAAPPWFVQVRFLQPLNRNVEQLAALGVFLK